MSLSRAFSQTNPGVGIRSTTYTNQFQGGGNKKAGFPYQVGRDMWASIAIQTCNPTSSNVCCTLANWNRTRLPLANISRPIGSTVRPNPYWKIPGAGPG